ncbi:hypothetical protein TGAM01_v207212 [Trichoderma gamsii]|uniref:Uncharacterized protein n=1 Tax=Trichoderma gamsii TaxID=398673 RepID=A0A2P4ZHX8_9HYPO|nr:hypothetical protein TGAM01_v207212 [Trichoderma gamsii]PON23884.1 hypothetical protein TGAM01_v207212 [Trichoderma gamsii]
MVGPFLSLSSPLPPDPAKTLPAPEDLQSAQSYKYCTVQASAIDGGIAPAGPRNRRQRLRGAYLLAAARAGSSTSAADDRRKRGKRGSAPPAALAPAKGPPPLDGALAVAVFGSGSGSGRLLRWPCAGRCAARRSAAHCRPYKPSTTLSPASPSPILLHPSQVALLCAVLCERSHPWGEAESLSPGTGIAITPPLLSLHRTTQRQSKGTRRPLSRAAAESRRHALSEECLVLKTGTTTIYLLDDELLLSLDPAPPHSGAFRIQVACRGQTDHWLLTFRSTDPDPA